MTGRRAIGFLLATAAALVVLVTPVAGGTFACTLQATEGGGSAVDVDVGEEVVIEGFEFPPGAVEVSFSVEGTPISTVMVTADGAGTWSTTITPQPGQEGLWTVEATAAADVCTGTTTFPVFGVTPTTAPTAMPVPTQAPLPNVAAAPPSDAAPALLVGAAMLALSAITLWHAFKRGRA